MNENSNKIQEILGEDKVKINEPMSKHTTLKVGGTADIFVLPDSVEDIKKTLLFAKEQRLPVTIVGNGSKLLIRDGGIRGVVIKLAHKFADIKVSENKIEVSAGMSLPKLSNIAKENGLSGLEFACGIPATVGGAIYMNAGAYDGDMSSVIESVTYIDESLNLCRLEKSELEFGYRSSIFKIGKIKGTIISCVISLGLGDKQEIEEKMKKNNAARKEKQPLEYPSAGSTFKRPEGYYVGKLIDDAGLKGYKIGGAEVSTKHSGFIVNVNNATAKDVELLIEKIKEEIQNKFGVKLEEEIIILGDEN